ncbi:hypothetical protein ACFX2C_012679 [Malus domestica]
MAKEHQDATIKALEIRAEKLSSLEASSSATQSKQTYSSRAKTIPLEPYLAQKIHQIIASTFGDPIVPEIPLVLEVTDPPTFWAALTDVFEVPASQPQVLSQVSIEGLGTASSPLVSHDSPPQQLEEVTPYPPPPKVPSSTQVYLRCPLLTL